MTAGDGPRHLAEAEAAFARGDLAAAEREGTAAATFLPASARPRHLLALVARRRGDGQAALTQYEAAIRLDPRDATICNNLGNLLTDLGRVEEALDHYRAAVALIPGYADAWINLALAAKSLQRLDEARDAAECGTGFAPHSSRAWAALAEVCRALGDLDAAAGALDRLLALTPDDSAAVQVRARIEADRGGNAGLWLRRAATLVPGDRAVLLATTAWRIASGEAAPLDALERALASDPGWVDGHRELTQFRAQLGDPNPDRSFSAAICDQPANAMLRYHHIALLRSAERHADGLVAIAAARGPLAGQPNAVALLDQFEAVARDEIGDLDCAARLFAPYAGTTDVTLATAIIRNALRRRAFDQAARVSEALVAAGGGRHGWAYLATAWRLTGDARADWLDGDPRLVGVADIGGIDLDALGARLRDLHVTRAQPIDQSLRGGTQTVGDILLRSEPLFHDLRAMLVEATRAHVAQLPPPDERHPTLCEPRDGVRIAGGWSVRLTGGGFHVSHIHPQGWLSSAFYVALPKGMGGEAHDGWLALGTPPVELGLDLPPLRLIEPKPGRLVLFPSMMWHGTLPFGAGERLTVAFDAVPVYG